MSSLTCLEYSNTHFGISIQFYFNRDWESSRQGGLCTGAARPLRYRPGGWEEFHHWQANGGVGALMEYQVRLIKLLNL